MNSACSCCLETFPASGDISTTPCGHVFHTKCITKWLENKQNCAQCQNSCNPNQIIKLYFSEADPENSLGIIKCLRKKDFGHFFTTHLPQVKKRKQLADNLVFVY